jgi:hypothetical protein
MLIAFLLIILALLLVLIFFQSLVPYASLLEAYARHLSEVQDTQLHILKLQKQLNHCMLLIDYTKRSLEKTEVIRFDVEREEMLASLRGLLEVQLTYKEARGTLDTHFDTLEESLASLSPYPLKDFLFNLDAPQGFYDHVMPSVTHLPVCRTIRQDLRDFKTFWIQNMDPSLQENLLKQTQEKLKIDPVWDDI